MFTHNWPLRGQARNSLQGGQVYDVGQFRNSISVPATEKSQYIPLTRPSQQESDAASPTSAPNDESGTKSLLWPAVAITIPIALLSATLLALVFGYQVRSQPSIFDDGARDFVNAHKPYVLVNYSATRLVFAASFLSTVAPLLASFIMSLYGLVVAAQMRQASTYLHFDKLPTPYQLSILVGLCLASIEQLRTYLWYSASRKRDGKLPAILNKAALMFAATILLAVAVFLSDTALHYITSTIVFDRITAVRQPMQEFGYGLSSLCLDLDRVRDNYGFPCSEPLGEPFEDPNRIVRRNEMNRLQSNTSLTSQIRVTGSADAESDMAILIPNPAKLSPGRDYRASTVGIGTQCRLIPPAACNLMAIVGEDIRDKINTQFNCSDDFFGILGISPNMSSVSGEKPVDPNLSPLGFKPATNLQWAFFTDDNLTTLYNPESWDPATNQPDALHIWADQKLINPFYLGAATRNSINTFTDGSSITTHEPDVFNNGNGYLDAMLRCSVTSYEVDYTWFRSSIENVTAVKSENGSLLEIFHGAQTYFTVTGGGFDLQQYLVDAAIAGNDTASYLTTWSNLYSVKVLSQIGAYLSSRTNLQEQHRESLLVAKVPKSALGALIACSLIYTTLGIFLVVAAWKASMQSVEAIASQLSLAGLTNMAFGEGKHGSPSYMPSRNTTLTPGSATENQQNGEDYFTRLPKRETRKVRISGTDFRVWV